MAILEYKNMKAKDVAHCHSICLEFEKLFVWFLTHTKKILLYFKTSSTLFGRDLVFTLFGLSLKFCIL